MLQIPLQGLQAAFQKPALLIREFLIGVNRSGELLLDLRTFPGEAGDRQSCGELLEQALIAHWILLQRRQRLQRRPWQGLAGDRHRLKGGLGDLPGGSELVNGLPQCRVSDSCRWPSYRWSMAACGRSCWVPSWPLLALIVTSPRSARARVCISALAPAALRVSSRSRT